MKKVIKPSKQPTKKRSQLSQRTAKLTIAISKIAAQLVKDHPKLIKGGGSLGITELLFSKILIKGGKLNEAARGKIITFLDDIVPQVNKLKNDLITKLLEYLATKDIVAKDDNICVNISNIINEFMKGLYDYDIKDEDQDQIGVIKEEIKEYFAILDIVRKFYILSRLKDDETGAFASTKNKINENKFEPLPSKILEALREKNENLKKLIEEYLKKKNRDNDNGNDNGEPEVKEDDYDETLKNLRTTLEKIKKGIDEYDALFANDKIPFDRGNNIYNFDTSKIKKPTDDQQNALNELNFLHSEFKNNVNDEYLNISSRYTERKKYKKENIEADLASLLILNATFNELYISQDKKDSISGYLNTIDPGRIAPENKEIFELGWGKPLVIPSAVPSVSSSVVPPARQYVKSIVDKFEDLGKNTGGNPAKYKSTGQVVYIMYKNKKYKRVIYVKDKRNTRYCKINKEYILLSKLKVIQ
jgi:hypothetical protein